MPAGDPVYADEVESSEQAPIGRCVASIAQALADNVSVAIGFTTEEFDSHGQHSTSSNSQRVTPNVPGIYRFDGTVWFEGQVGPVLSDVSFRLNGITYMAGVGTPGFTTQFSLSTTLLIPMNGTTDYVELVARQNSNTADNTYFLSFLASTLQWKRERALIV
jgi:hypothetical protein